MLTLFLILSILLIGVTIYYRSKERGRSDFCGYTNRIDPIYFYS